MMNKKQLLDFSKNILRHKNDEYSNQMMHPEREWMIGIIFAVLVFAVSALWSANTYLYYQTVSLGEYSAGGEDVVVYRASLVEAALEIFSQKQTTFTSLLKTNQPTLVIVDEVATSSSPSASSTETVIPPSAEGEGAAVEELEKTETETEVEVELGTPAPTF